MIEFVTFILIILISVFVLCLLFFFADFPSAELEKLRDEKNARAEKRAQLQKGRFDLEREAIADLKDAGWTIKPADREYYSSDTDIGWIATKGEIIAIISVVPERIKRTHILENYIGLEDYAADFAVVIARENKMSEISRLTADGLKTLILTPDEVPYFASSV